MGRKKKRADGAQQIAAIGASPRNQYAKVLKQFVASEDKVYTFEDSLTAEQRANVHQLCRKLGLKSRSSGPKSRRRLSIFKVEKDKLTKKNENIPSFTISEESKKVLMDLFTHFPPEDSNVEVNIVANHRKGAYHIKKCDDFLRRPKMGKDEIAKKMERISKTGALSKINESRSRLPIAPFKDVITSTVQSKQVVLISGETGCGKTTQVPQFLLEHMWAKGMACKIVCTQPRRISATSVAERISQERGETIGQTVGYKIRFDKKGGRNSSIVLCTNGIFLKVLVSSGASASRQQASIGPSKNEFSDLTHIIMDEIHERDYYSDFILAILRDVLPLYPELRLVLMSATINAKQISEYFGGCPVIHIPGFTYPVKTYYLDDVLTLLMSSNENYSFPASSQTKGCGSNKSNNNSKLSEEFKSYLDEAIDLACSNDDASQLIEILHSDGTPEIVNYKHSSTGVTPLMVLAGMGRFPDVCLLLSLGADCTVHARDGTTALMRAEVQGWGEVVELLKENMKVPETEPVEMHALLDKYLASVDHDVIDIVLIEKLLRKICDDSTDGAILVFLPGWEDINRVHEKLLSSPFFSDMSKFVIHRLHSRIASSEQRKVFIHPQSGCRKIILSTNIAETSITIDDIVYVIDSGWMKERRYDPHSNVSAVESICVSKANAQQREGRAGRCQAGFCYHLYSKRRAKSLPDFQIPELQRMPVDYICLQIKLLDRGLQLEDFLYKTMDPPTPEAILNAVISLQDIGALSAEEELTELGEKLAMLPMQPSQSKMLLFAIMVNCLDPALTLACSSELADLFVVPSFPREREKVTAAKEELAFLYGGHSDQLAVVAAFECWKKAKEKGLESRFCGEYSVSVTNMRTLSLMREQLREELIHNGFITGEASECNINSRSPGVLHTILVVGLYPMVGKLVRRKRVTVDTVNNCNVRLHASSLNSKLSKEETDACPLVVYNEIMRGDWGMHIRDCTIIGPLPVLLVGADIAVAEGDEDAGGTEEDVMSDGDNGVSIVIDRWLLFASTAFDVALIYCMRERINAAILFRVKHPLEPLPEILLASVFAVSYVLSNDALRSEIKPVESKELLVSILRGTDMARLTSSPCTPAKGWDLNLERFVRCLSASREHLEGATIPPRPTPSKGATIPPRPTPSKGGASIPRRPPLSKGTSVPRRPSLSTAAKPGSCVPDVTGPYGLKGDLLKRRRGS